MRSTLRIRHAVTIVTLRQRRLLAALVIAIVTSGNAQTESQVVTVSGTVADVTGARVRGASIQLASPGAPYEETTTDGKGDFEITARRPGDYILQAVARGFAAYKLPVHLSATAPITIRIVLLLDPASVCEPCVSSEPPIETLDASLSTTLPLLPMPPFKQSSKKSHPLAR
jgi:hypothetical protein